MKALEQVQENLLQRLPVGFTERVRVTLRPLAGQEPIGRNPEEGRLSAGDT